MSLFHVKVSRCISIDKTPRDMLLWRSFFSKCRKILLVGMIPVFVLFDGQTSGRGEAAVRTPVLCEWRALHLPAYKGQYAGNSHLNNRQPRWSDTLRYISKLTIQAPSSWIQTADAAVNSPIFHLLCEAIERTSCNLNVSTASHSLTCSECTK